jgi:putative ABC transport system permease protein
MKQSFDFDMALRNWRTSIGQSTTFLATDLDELEDHLVQEYESIRKAGISDAMAFRQAVSRIGQRHELEQAFREVRFGKSKRLASFAREGQHRFSLAAHQARIALRRMRRKPLIAAVNLTGMFLAALTALTVGTALLHQLSFDRFHPAADDLYRIHAVDEGEERVLLHASIGQQIEDRVPEVMRMTRVFKHWESPLISKGEDGRIEPGFYFAESDFLGMFGVPLAMGNPSTALDAPGKVILTHDTADRLFPNEDPLGKRLIYNDAAELTVTGVFAPWPDNSHLQPDFVASLSTLPQVSFSGILDQWSVFHTYVQLVPGAPAPVLTSSTLGIEADSERRFAFFPVPDIHLRSASPDELEPAGSLRFVWLMASIMAMVILIASVNHINLATAQAIKRARETAIRKVAGAARAEIAIQQFMDTFVLIGLSAGLALASLFAFKNPIEEAFGIALTSRIDPATVLLTTLIAGIVLSLIAGLYPAWVVSRYQPAGILKGIAVSGRSGRRIRNGLVFGQFAVSAILIVLTFTVTRQMQFIGSTDLGFETENVVVIPVQGEAARSAYPALRAAWESIPMVASMGATASAVPGQPHSANHVVRPAGSDESADVRVQRNWVDSGYFESLQLTLNAGEGFRAQPGTNSDEIILNETAARLLGWSDPSAAVGQILELNPGSENRALTIRGVVEDYHFTSLHTRVAPLIHTVTNYPTKIVLRTAAGASAADLEALRESWDRIVAQPFSASWLSDDLAQQYKQEVTATSRFTWASIMALVISALGLFGLASFIAETRTREIGIRKALGATTSGIVWMISLDITRIIGLAIVLSAPAAWILSSRWLDAFAYRTNVGWEAFILAGLILLVTGWLTILGHATRAASIDPARCLRTD